MTELIHKPLIRRKPFDGVQGFGSEPGGGFVFIQMKRVRKERAQEAVHGQMKIGIVPLDGFQQVAYLDFRIQFLLDFTHKSLLRALPALDLASGKFPPALPLAVSALSGEYLTILDYNSSYDFYCLHYSSK